MSAQPSRVALVPSSYDPHVGGVEEHARNLARLLHARGHAVEVWTVDRGEHLSTRTLDGVRVRYLPTPLPARTREALGDFAASAMPAWHSWTDALRDFRPDVLHVQCFGPNGLYALALLQTRRVPLVLSSHGETFADDHRVFDHSRLLRLGLRRACRKASAVTGCSSVVTDDLRLRFGAKDPVVVPNGVDLDECRAEPASPGFDASVPTVFAIGRIERIKGFDLLLRAFARADLPSGVRLVVAGDGGALPSLRALASELGVGARTDFPGRLERAQVAASMAAATVNVVPSRVEAFGIVVLEAWRSGRPLIATNRGGPGTLVTDGVDGLLVDPDDTDAFPRTLERVVSDPELALRLAAAGAQTVRRYTWDTVVDRYEDLYRRVLAPAASGSG